MRDTCQHADIDITRMAVLGVGGREVNTGGGRGRRGGGGGGGQ